MTHLFVVKPSKELWTQKVDQTQKHQLFFLGRPIISTVIKLFSYARPLKFQAEDPLKKYKILKKSSLLTCIDPYTYKEGANRTDCGGFGDRE